MDRGEILDRGRRHGDTRIGEPRNWKRWKERERQVGDGRAKFRPIRSIPGINRIERFERGNSRGFIDADQVEAGVGDGSGPVGKADQGESGTWRPDLSVIGPRLFELRKRKNHVPDRPGTDQ